jgi:hypothetical protein
MMKGRTMAFRANPSKPQRRLRSRAVSLIEAIFYLTVTASVLTLTAQILDREASRETNEAFAADLRQMIAAARIYAQAKPSDIAQFLFDATTNANDPLVTDIPLSELVNAQVLPGVFGQAGGSGLAMQNNKEYRLWVRGITDGAVGAASPAVTAIRSEVSDSAGMSVTDTLLDRDPSNGELWFEMVLVTRDPGIGDGVSIGDPEYQPVFNRADGNRIVAETGLPTAGFIGTDIPLVASGAYGSWELDLSPFQDLGAYDSKHQKIANNFAGLIQIPIHGVLSRAAGPNALTAEDMFARCAALPDGHPLQDECFENPTIWTDMVFDGLVTDGVAIILPGIQNVYEIAMADPEDYAVGLAAEGSYRSDIANIRGLSILEMRDPFSSGNDPNRLDVFPTISNVTRLTMGRAGSVTDGIPASAFGDIRNLHGLSCEAGGITDLQDGRFVVDCAETVFSRTLAIRTPDPSDSATRLFDVSGEAEFRGAVSVQSTAPTLSLVDSSGARTRLDNEQIFMSDGGEYLRVDPGQITASGKVRVAALSTPALNLVSDSVNVRDNLRRRPMTAVSAADGSSIAFARPTCASGSDILFQVISVIPPGPETQSPPHDVVQAVRVLANKGGDPLEVEVTVVYADIQATKLICDIDITRAEFEYDRTPLNIVTDLRGLPAADRTTNRTEKCTYESLTEVSDSVLNPAGTRVAAIVGCE